MKKEQLSTILTHETGEKLETEAINRGDEKLLIHLNTV